MIRGTIFVLLVVVVATIIAQDRIDNVAFIKLGSYKLDSYREKVYYVSRYFRSYWGEVKANCMAYGMDFVSLETAAEANSFLELCKKNAASFTLFSHIGAMTTVAKSQDKWFWVNSGNRITYPIKWSPGQPDNSAGQERCLSIKKETNNSFLFNDLECHNIHNHYFNYVCQQENILL